MIAAKLQIKKQFQVALGISYNTLISILENLPSAFKMSFANKMKIK
jgi:hypothetical protein